MTTTKIISVLMVSGLFVFAIFFFYTLSKYKHAFSETKNGDAVSLVIERFGEPSVREQQNSLYARYANSPCVKECVARLWYENPALRGIEAWSVEINSEGRVVNTAHWVSP